MHDRASAAFPSTLAPRSDGPGVRVERPLPGGPGTPNGLTDLPTTVARAPYPMGGIRRILLATDLSPASEGAALQALDLAHDLGSELLIVSVIDPGSLLLPGGRFGARVDQVRAAREAAAQDLVSRGRAAGVRVNFLIWEGEPGESIVDAARSEQVDLVVVGSHGRGAVGRFFIGSVSDHVVRHAHCPVLVVRARASAEPA